MWHSLMDRSRYGKVIYILRWQVWGGGVWKSLWELFMCLLTKLWLVLLALYLIHLAQTPEGSTVVPVSKTRHCLLLLQTVLENSCWVWSMALLLTCLLWQDLQQHYKKSWVILMILIHLHIASSCWLPGRERIFWTDFALSHHFSVGEILPPCVACCFWDTADRERL